VNKNSKGFTLIELIITVGILGLLAAIAIPSYQDQIRKARRADATDALLDCAAVQARNFSTSSPPRYLTNADLGGAGGVGLCNGLVSKEGFYTLTVNNAACPGANPWCFTITATPVAGGAQANDGICASMTVDHRGNKAATNNADPDAGDDTTAICWRS